jgi:hypothetical protein
MDIDLEVVPFLPFEAELHTPLVCRPHILQSERYFHIAKIATRSDECGSRLVCLGEAYLVITRVSVQETQGLTPGSEVDDLVNTLKGEQILPCCYLCAGSLSLPSGIAEGDYQWEVQTPDGWTPY